MNAFKSAGNNFDKQADGLVRLFRSLAESRPSSDCLFVLIDPLLADPLPELEAIERVPVHALRIRHEDLAQEATPYLLRIGREQDHERLVSQTLRRALAEQQAALVESPASRAICAWLFVDESKLSKLIDNLSRLALINRSERPGKSSLFRFWDPRVFQHLSRILGEQELTRSLADNLNLQWLWLAPNGKLSSQIFSDGVGWRPSPLQLQALSRVEDLNQCLLLSDTQSLADLSAAITCLDAGLERASHLGCYESGDRITYALLLMSLGGPFEGHALMTDAFRHVRQHQASLAALAEAVEQDVWDSIRRDMAQARNINKSAIEKQ